MISLSNRELSLILSGLLLLAARDREYNLEVQSLYTKIDRKLIERGNDE